MPKSSAGSRPKSRGWACRPDRPRSPATSAIRADDGELRRASRSAARRVDYRLIRARRRSIGMEIGLAGLTVRAPRWVTLREIEAALAERAHWILRALAEWRAPPARRAAARMEDRRADPLPRRELALDVHPGARDGRSRRPVPPDGPASGRRTTSARSRASSAAGCRTRRCAARPAAGRALRGAPRTRRRPPCGCRTRAANGAAATSTGEIRLNWRLVQLPPALADYVVAHEVAHLVELNHSRALLGAGRGAVSRARARAARARRLDGAARGLIAQRRARPPLSRTRGAARSPARDREARLRAAAARASAPPSSSPDARVAPASAVGRGSESRRAAPPPRSRDSARAG